MKFSGFLLVFLLVVIPLQAQAGQNNQFRLAKRLMSLTRVPQMMDQVFSSVRKAQLEKLADLEYPGKSPQADQELARRVNDYLAAATRWSHFEDGFAKVYASLLNEDELQLAVDFYSSDAAKKLIGNDRLLKQQLLETAQLQMKDMAIRIREIEREFVREQGQ